MNCIDCRYNLLKDGHYNCTYEEGECIKINVLVKENAELKEKLNFSTQYYQGEKAQKQLSKAKEILREYIRINLLPPIERNFNEEVKLFKQAEQFLEDVSE